MVLLLLVLTYLFGSIPTAVWIGETLYDIDVREYGSGNAGSTNTFRVLGKKAGISVMLIDILKGWIATKFVYLMGPSITGPAHSIQFINYQFALGSIAVIGHIFPIFAGFRGGKGIATSFGMILSIHPQASLLCVAMFLVVLLVTRYVSLSSIMAGLTFPLSIIFVFHVPIQSIVIYGMSICILILVTHQKNIERLLAKKESKVNLCKKEKIITN